MAFGPNKTEGKNGYFKFGGKDVFLHLDTNKEAWATLYYRMLSYNCGWREPQVNKLRMKEQQEPAPSTAAWTTKPTNPGAHPNSGLKEENKCSHYLRQFEWGLLNSIPGNKEFALAR